MVKIGSTLELEHGDEIIVKKNGRKVTEGIFLSVGIGKTSTNEFHISHFNIQQTDGSVHIYLCDLFEFQLKNPVKEWDHVP